MESKGKNIPKLRFPSFEGDWEVEKIHDLFEIRNGYTPSKATPEYWENGTIPWFRMEDIRENGNILYDSMQHISKSAIKGNKLFKANSIIVATSATIGEHALIKVDSMANQRFTNLAIKENYAQLLDTMYIYHYMFIVDEICKKNTNMNAFASVDMKTFGNIPFSFPALPEQQKIASCLSSLDGQISAEQSRLESLSQHKRGLMQQLFPQEGETAPKLRFTGFEGDWEFVSGDTLFEPISNKHHNSDLPLLALTQDQGAVPRELIDYNVIATEKSISGYKVVEVGDFIISLRSFQGGIEYSRYRGLCSPAYIILRGKNKKIVSDFYRIYFKSHKYIQELNKNLEGIRDGKMISYKQFSEINLPFPTLPEQQKIASCLTAIDNLIAAQQERIEALKQHKRGLMQQLFPAVANE